MSFVDLEQFLISIFHGVPPFDLFLKMDDLSNNLKGTPWKPEIKNCARNTNLLYINLWSAQYNTPSFGIEWNGTEWNRTEQNGSDWNKNKRNGMERNGIEWNGTEQNGTEWIWLEQKQNKRNGTERNGIEWNGTEWNRTEWNGTEWNANQTFKPNLSHCVPPKVWKQKWCLHLFGGFSRPLGIKT